MRPSGPLSTRVADGLAALHDAVLYVLNADALGEPAVVGAGPAGGRARNDAYLPMAADAVREPRPHTAVPTAGGPCDGDTTALRITALVDLARDGDAEAFGQLYDHYANGVYRYLYYRVSSTSLAEDLTSETFFRALRSIRSFQWQGRDFGAWLTTIARNLVTDHFKSSRSRLEVVSDVLPESSDVGLGPEAGMLTALTSELIAQALSELARDQQDCLVMRFLQGLSIADTAAAMGRSEGAVKQLQLRAVRNLAKVLSEDAR